MCGSASWGVRARFQATVLSMGGTVKSLQGVGSLSPLTSVAMGVPLQRLSEELAWPIGTLRSAARLRGPASWSVAPAGIDKHRLHKEWSWSAGEFRDLGLKAAAEEVDVRWWRRVEADREDLYSVDGGSPVRFVSPSRSVALCEAFRRARRAMFLERGALLTRLSASGHLPLHLACTLHALTLRSPGVIPCGTSWGYAYPSCALGLNAVRACLGRHIVRSEAAPTRFNDPLSSRSIGMARHRADRTMRTFAS